MELIVLGPVKSGTDVSLLLANQLQDPRKRKNTYCKQLYWALINTSKFSLPAAILFSIAPVEKETHCLASPFGFVARHLQNTSRNQLFFFPAFSVQFLFDIGIFLNRFCILFAHREF